MHDIPPSRLLVEAKVAKKRDKVQSVETILFYGQSNAGGGGRDKPELVQPIDQKAARTFSSRGQSYGSRRIDPDELWSLAGVADGKKAGPRGATAMAFALNGATWADTPPDLSYFMFSVWYGNQPLSSFVRGTDAWTNLMDAIGKSEEMLADTGRRSSVGALVLLQGESGPRGRAVYRAELNLLLDDLLEEIRRRTHQTDKPLCLLAQINRNAEACFPPTGVELAQWDVARERDDTIMAGPCYQLPLVDRIHHRSNGRMMLGEMLAYAYTSQKRRGKPFLPLHPMSAEQRGRRIRIGFHLPEPANGLAWDRDWVASCTERGFAFTDSTRSASVTGAVITGPAEVTLVLDAVPTGDNKIVSYAQEQPHRLGWASGRGQLINPTDHPSYFASLGYQVPATFSHYCLRFELPVD